MGGKRDKRKHGSDKSRSSKAASAEMSEKPGNDQYSYKKVDHSAGQTSFIRKPIDPETAKYFAEITSVLERQDNAEERPFICDNALEEARGKELELATDHIISYTMQMLLDECDGEHLCRFLRSCAKDFALIATDSCGSHVAETALKSLSIHLQAEDFSAPVEEALTLMCQAIVINPVTVICNCHGSHVVRSLLCLCKGVPLDSEFHTPKSSSVLTQRFTRKEDKNGPQYPRRIHQGFPDLLYFLVSNLLKCNKADIAILQEDQYGSLVLQTALRLLAGEEQLLSIIPAILGSNTEELVEGNLIQMTDVQNFKHLIKENAFSHLMETILEVAPDVLYAEILDKIFKNSLFDMSGDPSANFAVQALISNARSPSQIEAIWEELGSKFKDLFLTERPGVVASLVSACHRLQTYEHKCAKALASAVSSTNDSAKDIVPRLLQYQNYIYSEDKANWKWDNNSKVHVLGSLLLQTIFKYPTQHIQPYITSMTSIENDHAIKIAKDGGGARVVEAFLTSGASDKQKCKMISKLKGHFAELAMHPSGSFTIDKCFSASDVPLREVIVSELVPIQKTLLKSRQGGILRSLDVEGYAQRPDQWRSRQKSKISVQKNFLAEFDLDKRGIGASKRSKDVFPDNLKKASQQTDMKQMRQEIEQSLTSNYKQDKKRRKKEKH